MSEIISIIADLALTLSLIVALIFGIAQVRAVARDRRERLTLETLHTFQTRETAELMLFVNNQKLPSTLEGLRALPISEQAKIFQFGQQMESLGLLLAERFINIDLVDKTLGSFVVTAWQKYKAMFYDIREKTSDPFLGEYFQWMAEQMDKRLTENPRKPFHENPVT
ncbi:MAG TPA: hypothetical protein VFI06_13700 [Chitinophagaceae bacterium]|nr:hypothetical protein [Chitinophagaceae bacterium]